MKRALIFLLCLLITPAAFAKKGDMKKAAYAAQPKRECFETAEGFIPGSVAAGHAGYWETPMDVTNEESIQRMLSAPVTVIKGHQKEQIYLLAEPRIDAAPVAEVTCDSQGLHVLEEGKDGWTLVECRSSSFHGSHLERWNELVRGYVPSDRLDVKTPVGDWGLVADKLTQRLYVFEKGRLVDTLRISTGLPNERQPYNETRSGEFLLVSPVGDFKSDNLVCAMGLRFNFGDILHEVPHIAENGGKNYATAESKLGRRASHGCIRVQRRKTDKGGNMAWLWKTLSKQMGVKLVIWEDAPGRQIPLPDDEENVYRTGREKDKWYHRAPTCRGVNDKDEPMRAMPYGRLRLPENSRLKPCAYCVPPDRPETIEEVNAAHGRL